MPDLVAAPDAPDPDVSVLIPAAGRGDRLGKGPKAFLELAGRPMLAWVAGKALRLAGEVVIAAPPGHLDRMQDLCAGCTVIEGGSTRQDSIGRLVEVASRPWLLIQDAARPFATLGLMRTVLEAARGCGAAGAFLDPEVPVAVLREGLVVQDFRADQVGVFQAPQAFERNLLVQVLAQAAARGWCEQSTLQLVLRAGLAVRTVPGEKTNLKLTTEVDLDLAAGLSRWLA